MGRDSPLVDAQLCGAVGLCAGFWRSLTRPWPRPLGAGGIRWGLAGDAGVDAAAFAEVFDPGGDPGVDLVAGGASAPVVVLACEGDPQGFGRGVVPARPGPAHRDSSAADGAS